jgi:hypothetical protein
MPPSGCSWSPVAVTTRSAGSSRPDASRMPSPVNVSIASVTTDTRPEEIAANRSLSGMMHMRSSHGS